MKRFLTIILILLWPLTAHAWMAKVVSVTDGDTIKVFNAEQGQIKVRLYGIDTPEKGQPYSKAAGKYLASLIAGATVEVESVTKDRYGRTVGIVWDSEVNINQEMVRAGYAWVYRKYCDKYFCSEWLGLEDKARSSRIGLWQEPDPIPPWEWRRRK
jgi:endonuclease YncB( thermonuclease family)